MRTLSKTALARTALCGALGALLFSPGCTDPDTFVPFDEFGGPAGVIAGNVTYSGPPPCTQNGRILGAAILLAFEENLLPPPEGLGTAPIGLSVVAGEELFRGIRADLGFDANGALKCPGPGAAPVVVSAEIAVSPLPAGVYEIRGFYDYDNDFNPGFSLFNLPTAGDIGGGAIENATAVLQGAAPQYRRIPIGTLDDNGTRTIPPSGVLVEGVAVTLGLPLPLERPVFHVREVLDEHFGNSDPSNIVIPADYQLNVFSIADPEASEASFIRLVLGASVPDSEVALATESPFFFPTASPFILHTRQDVNLDGVIDQLDGIPETSLIPALRPLGLLTRTVDGNTLVSQRPSVLLQGITLLDNLLATVAAPVDLADPRPEMLLALRPAVLCIDPFDTSKDGVLVNTHLTDTMGNTLVVDPEPVEAALAAQFGRKIAIVTGCLPEGTYNLNLVYDTGQAWTIPNESGQCAEGEAMSSDGGQCGSRARLRSQDVVVTIGPPDDASYCAANPTPSQCIAIE